MLLGWAPVGGNIFPAERNHLGNGAVEKNMLHLGLRQYTGHRSGNYFDSMSLSQNLGCVYSLLMATCRYNVPVVSPGKTKKVRKKQNKTKQNKCKCDCYNQQHRAQPRADGVRETAGA